jgi:protein-S-isoprenylcysteine O-methyltransferase Ste14
VKSLVETLWDCISPGCSSDPQVRPHAWQGETLARLEGVLYVGCLQLGLGQLIGVWLAVKVAGQWKRWMDDGDEKTHRPDGRAVFNIFLIGNALSVLYSFVGYKLIGWIQAGRVLQVCWVSLSVIALTLVLWAWIPAQRKSRFL